MATGDEFCAIIGDVARRLYGEPNAALSTRHELRYGTHGSLSIRIDKGTWYSHEECAGGGTLDLVRRETGFANGEAVEWLRAEGFIAAEPEPASRPRIVATYDYVDEAGELLFQVCRRTPKDFRQRRPDGNGGWIWKLEDTRRVPYRLPELLRAVNVFIVEGEKDADRLRAEANVAATCNPGGAGKWLPEFAEHFLGKIVYVVPDADEPGRKHAEAVCANLYGVADSVRVITLPGGKDVSEWFDAGGTAAELYALAEAAGVWEPKSAEEPDRFPRQYTADQLEHAVFPPIKYVVAGLVTEGLTILAARPKLGKSWMGLDLSIAVSYGGVALGNISVEQGDVLYAAMEDNERRFQKRMRNMLRNPGWPKRLTIWHDMPRLDAGGIEALEAWIKSVPKGRLIILDTWAKIRGTRSMRDTTYEGDYAAMAALHKLASDYGIAILVIHHTRKAESDEAIDSISGTLGLAGAADSVLVITRTPKGTTLYATGRDIEEQEIAVEFEKDLCRWKILGDAAEVQRSAQRRAILEALADAGEPMGPRDIADATGNSETNIKFLLRKMVKDGEVTKLERGRYKCS